MNDLSDVAIVPLENSNFVQPFRMLFKHAGKDRLWDLVRVHERYNSLQYSWQQLLCNLIIFSVFLQKTYDIFFLFSVAIIIFNISNKKLIFVRQFRPGMCIFNLFLHYDKITNWFYCNFMFFCQLSCIHKFHTSRRSYKSNWHREISC